MKYYNLTTPQKNIWNLQKYYGDTSIGNQCGAIFYKEKRDNDLLKRAISGYKLPEWIASAFCRKRRAGSVYL